MLPEERLLVTARVGSDLRALITRPRSTDPPASP
jgi:hypothetical protein